MMGLTLPTWPEESSKMVLFLLGVLLFESHHAPVAQFFEGYISHWCQPWWQWENCSPTPWLWIKVALSNPRVSSLRVTIDRASLRGPPGFLYNCWCSLSLFWPYSVNVLLEFTSFLTTLHRPQGAADLGNVVFPALNCLFCLNKMLVIG